MGMVLRFVLNVMAALVLFLVFRTLLNLIPGFSGPRLFDWSMAEFIGLFAALYLLAIARRRIPLLSLSRSDRK